METWYWDLKSLGSDIGDFQVIWISFDGESGAVRWILESESWIFLHERRSLISFRCEKCLFCECRENTMRDKIGCRGHPLVILVSFVIKVPWGWYWRWFRKFPIWWTFLEEMHWLRIFLFSLFLSFKGYFCEKLILGLESHGSDIGDFLGKFLDLMKLFHWARHAREMHIRGN